MNEAEVADAIVLAMRQAELAITRGSPGMAEVWLNIARQWTYLLENVDLDYELEEEPELGGDDDELAYEPEISSGNSGILLDDFSHLVPAGLDDDDDPDDIKRLGPIEPL